jgi:hypothetical protein
MRAIQKCGPLCSRCKQFMAQHSVQNVRTQYGSHNKMLVFKCECCHRLSAISMGSLCHRLHTLSHALRREQEQRRKTIDTQFKKNWSVTIIN